MSGLVRGVRIGSREKFRMCFSATASFTLGAALIPAGAYCVYQACVKKPSYLGLATVPLLFGIQQICEGFVWLGIHDRDLARTRTASLAFLFFALAVWPFWFPLQAAIMERDPPRRTILIVVSLLSMAWFWVLFWPIVSGPETLLETRVERHSIQYDYPELPIYRYIRVGVLRILYFATVALPFVISSERFGRLPGIALGSSALISAVVFHYAYVSVWCFFAAVLAIFFCFMFRALPARS